MASSASARKIENEPMLFNADREFADRNGGPILKDLLIQVSPLIPRDAPLSIDTRSHMLMRGWYPAIPGWHHDDVDRGENGQPDYDGDWLHENRIMICVALDADDAPTGSLTEWVDEPVNLRWPLPDDEPVYRYWDQQIDQEGFRTHTYPSGTIIRFTQESLHRAVPAAGSGWRWFCRITVNPGPRPDAPKVRKQTQVYLPTINKGW